MPRTKQSLRDIARLQVDLDRHNRQIKDLASTIIKALGAETNPELPTPILVANPRLHEVGPAIKAIEAELATLCQRHQQIQTDISHLMS